MKSKSKFLYYVISNIVLIVVVLTIFFVSIKNNKIINTNASVEKDSVIYQGNTKNNNISLMINVYWGTEFLEPMITIMEKYNVKSTFFIGGSWAVKNVDLLSKIYGNGHEIASHGYHHKDHAKISYYDNKQEIKITNDIIKVLIGVDMNLFAPPSGSFADDTLKVCKELNYKVIMWTKDTIDWRDKNSKLIFSRATKNASNGDLILMHPTLSTLNALEDIILELQLKNFNLCTVSENLKS